MDNTAETTSGQDATPVSQDSQERPRPVIEAPAPIAPGTAQLIITITNIARSEEATCAHGPCKAEARVEAVKGYGAGFTQAFGDGQIINVFFPTEMKRPGQGNGMIQEQDMLEVSLRMPHAEGGWYTVRSISQVKK